MADTANSYNTEPMKKYNLMLFVRSMQKD